MEEETSQSNMHSKQKISKTTKTSKTNNESVYASRDNYEFYECFSSPSMNIFCSFDQLRKLVYNEHIYEQHYMNNEFKCLTIQIE